MPEEAIIGALLFLLLLLSSALGLFLQGKLHERHRSRETIDAIRLVRKSGGRSGDFVREGELEWR